MKQHVNLHVVPASFFGMVLGLCGIANDWRAAARVWHFPTVIGEALMFVAVAVWAVLAVLYFLKWTFFREEALKEILHPVQCCFFGLAGVATMLVAAGILPYWQIGAECIFASGCAFTLVFAVWRTGGLWLGHRRHADTTAVLYLPTVAGSFVTAAVASALGAPSWGQLAFGAGLFSWFALESVLVHRLLTEESLPEALRPTLGIQLAPAPVAAVAYLAVSPSASDLVVSMLIGYGLLQALVLLRLLSWIYKPAYAASYWAFTFGATALAFVPLREIEAGSTGAVAQLAPYLFVAANALVLFVAAGTLNLALRGQLAPKRAASFPGFMRASTS